MIASGVLASSLLCGNCRSSALEGIGMLIGANGGGGMNERKMIEDCLRPRDS